MNRRYGIGYGTSLLALLIALVFSSLATAQTDGAVLLAKFKGPVTPVLAAYIERAIADAEASNAAALVIELDTPGGSVDITKNIIQQMTAARVPIIVYVAPRGAHAGSAGTFITLAGHFAAMAPGSSIGAASPVGAEGADLPETLKTKAVNILVADIKNLAARRGEKAVAWAEKAVTEAAAATADEALELGVIDVIAQDVNDLLRQLDGRTATVAGQAVTLRLSDLPIEEVPLSPLESFLNQLTNPALAAILLTIGLNAILFELSNPGGYVAGIIGVVCLLLAFYALGTLNANWAGLGFIALAFVLFVLDIKAPTHGVLTAGGIISFVFGAYMLFNTADINVPWLTIISLALATAAFFAFAIGKALAAQRRQPTTGMEGMQGQIGEVRRDLAPEGMVMVSGELWRAVSESGTIPVGEKVVVTGQEGFLLRVKKVP
ncbi:MAG: nodulation protein NfeD [Anaerolineae bacterium]|nr:nodulation protein NfeD [Anaerolineae bacterium]